MKADYQLERASGLAGASRRSVGYRSIISSLGVGAIAMFFMDPQRGRRRRAPAKTTCAPTSASW